MFDGIFAYFSLSSLRNKELLSGEEAKPRAFGVPVGEAQHSLPPKAHQSPCDCGSEADALVAHGQFWHHLLDGFLATFSYWLFCSPFLK